MKAKLPRTKATPVARVAQRIEMILKSDVDHPLKSESSYKSFLQKYDTTKSSCERGAKQLFLFSVLLAVFISAGDVTLPGIAANLKDVPGVLEVLVVFIPVLSVLLGFNYVEFRSYEAIIWKYNKHFSSADSWNADLYESRDISPDFYMMALGIGDAAKLGDDYFVSPGFRALRIFAKIGIFILVTAALFALVCLISWGNHKVWESESSKSLKYFCSILSYGTTAYAFIVTFSSFSEFEFSESE